MQTGPSAWDSAEPPRLDRLLSAALPGAPSRATWLQATPGVPCAGTWVRVQAIEVLENGRLALQLIWPRSGLALGYTGWAVVEPACLLRAEVTHLGHPRPPEAVGADAAGGCAAQTSPSARLGGG